MIDHSLAPSAGGALSFIKKKEDREGFDVEHLNDNDYTYGLG